VNSARSESVEEAHLRAWVSFMQAHAAVADAVERDLLRERDLSLSSHEVLARLARQPQGSMRMQDLARGALLSKSGLTRLVDRLQDAGLIDRRPCAEDRRVVYATLTPAGSRALSAAAPVFSRSLEEHFARLLPCDEVGPFLVALRTLIEGNGQQVLDECHSGSTLVAAETR
jgi:DNA-binding MarR family transcriptional regulator